MQATLDELPLVRVDLSLSAKQITAVFGVLVAAVGALGTAGWLVLPAKQTDLEQVRVVVQHMQNEFQQMQSVTLKLTSAVQDLVVSVDELRKAPPPITVQAAPGTRSREVKQAPPTRNKAVAPAATR